MRFIVRNDLKLLFSPTSVALIGASNRPHSLGSVVMKNLLQSGFNGCIMPVNHKSTHIEGIICYQDVQSLPITPDLAVFCIPSDGIAKILVELGERGTKAIVIISAGFEGDLGKTKKQEILKIIKNYNMRLIGPNCVGLIVPPVGLNASFSHAFPRSGHVAFVSQSGALVTSVIDWAIMQDIGFSHVISMGDMIDVEFGEVIDYLAQDTNTSSIILYIEAITNARRFISAARAASLEKPVVVLKSGRSQEGAKAAASHTGSLAGVDAVYDAVFSRCKLLRVDGLGELFNALETLSRPQTLAGEKLCIITNGGGIGVLATDYLMALGGKLATLRDNTILRLNEVLPAHWSHSNPVDIIGDATDQRYSDALRIIMDDEGVNAILVLNCPVGVVSSIDAAKAVVDTYKSSMRNFKPPLLTAWLGEDTALEARRLFSQNGIPSYATPASAVKGFKSMVDFYRYKQSSVELNDLSKQFDVKTAKSIIENAIAKGQIWLTEPEAKKVLAAYNIPVSKVLEVFTPKEAFEKAKEFHGKMVLKILSPDITHKSDSGGVVLNLKTPQEVEEAAKKMLANYKISHPKANILGFALQEMVERSSAHELILGLAEDNVFGPVILFGAGGKAVEMIQDKALAIPPLTPILAEEIIKRTRIYQLLKGYRDEPAANISAIIQVLVNLSELTIDLPMIKELDINPLLANRDGVIALDARIKVTHSLKDYNHLSIYPYPDQLLEEISLPDYKKLILRPVKQKDLVIIDEALTKIIGPNHSSLFSSVLNDEPHLISTRLTQVDYNKEITLLCINKSYKKEVLGIAYIKKTDMENSSHLECIFGVVPTFYEHANVLLDYVISYAKQLKGSISIFINLLDPLLEEIYKKAGFESITSDKKGIKRFALTLVV